MKIAAPQLLSKIPTGIQGFDELSRGGLPRNRTSLVMGGPGSGKTIFALQSLANAIRRRQEPGIFVAFEEGTRQIMANAATFDWDLPALAKNKLFFLDGHLSPTAVQSGEFDLTGMLAILKAKKEKMGAGWIVFDGIDVLLTLLRDPVSEMREIYRVRDWLADNELTAIITAKIDSTTSEVVNYGFMQFMVDCVIRFDRRLEHGVSVRRLQITKYRGSDFAAGEFSLSFGPSGMEVVAPEPAEIRDEASAEPVSTGFARLDSMLGGGLFRGSAHVCVLDSSGTVIMANKAWHAFADANGGIGAAGVTEGANYLAVCDQARGSERVDGIAIAAGIRQVIAGKRTLFRHEYTCDSPAGRCRFILTITGFPGDGAGYAVISRENITESERTGRLPELKYTAANQVPAENGLLAALPREEYQRLRAFLEPVTLTYGEVLYEPGAPIRHVYFPNNSLVSLLTTVDGHKALEVGLVGREGMVGIPLALGIGVSSVRALVQGTGKAMRMKSARFLEEFPQSPPLQRELYRYSHFLTTQVTQTAACNHFHMVEARLARWLLMTRDRMQSDQFRLTHEFLADMLGVRRVGVTKAASALQQRKLISYSRGNIKILDRKGLEAASCGCYQILKDFDSRCAPRRAEQRRIVQDRRELAGEAAGPSRRKAIVGETGVWLDRRATEGDAGGA